MVKLSVLVTFCNQRQYIKRALDSILAQKTNFDFEVLIGLDGVYDGARKSSANIRINMILSGFIKCLSPAWTRSA